MLSAVNETMLGSKLNQGGKLITCLIISGNIDLGRKLRVDKRAIQMTTELTSLALSSCSTW